MEETNEILGKKKKTHALILRAAKRLFEERGVLHVTIDHIAERAKICRSTYFTHFDSLDEMYSELIEQELIDLLSSVREGDIKSLIDRLVDDCVNYPKVFVELMVRGVLYGEKNSAYGKVSGVIADFVKGKNNIFSADEIADIILGTYFGTMLRKLAQKEEIDADEYKYSLYKVLEFFIE